MPASAERSRPPPPQKKTEIDTKNGLKNAKKDPKTIRNVSKQFEAPLTPLKNFSPALF